MTASSKSLGSISVFFPAFNDEPTIGVLVRNALAVLPEFTDDYEVLVINDGSVDGTAAIIDDLSRLHAEVKAIHHNANRGYGGALQSGFEHATKEFVFYTDGDGQYDVGELPKLLDLVAPDVGLVNGYKLERSDPWHRIAIGNSTR